ncbi:Uncharacterised protein [Salmonella enterica]|nr:Uncharacterised protein [Salmonella enterica]
MVFGWLDINHAFTLLLIGVMWLFTQMAPPGGGENEREGEGIKQIFALHCAILV